MSRGRPKKYPEYEQAILAVGGKSFYNRMSLNNNIYALIADGIIRKKAPKIWIHFSDESKGKYKSSLLAELGRWENEKDILELAKEYATGKYTVAQYIKIIRKIRLNPNFR